MNCLKISILATTVIFILINCNKPTEREIILAPKKEVNNPKVSENNISTKTFKIYLDADQTGARESGNSIALGIKTALSEHNFEVDGKSIELKILDHRGNFNRSTYHIKSFLEDSTALVMFCGLHSPPVLANINFINNNEIPFLDPWAAAAPITRGTDSLGRNWIFRLSIDDSKVGPFLIKKIVDNEKLQKVALLLEETGWGKSSYNSISKELEKRGLKPTITKYFKWNLKSSKANELIQDIYATGSEVIILVANAPEGKTIISSMLQRDPDKQLPIRSHWGITGGNFFKSIGDDIIAKELDLSFIQTSFSFINENLPQHKITVFNNLKKISPSIQSYKDLEAPTGFIHAYDLTNLLILAMKQIEWSNDIRENRILLRSSLENLNIEYHGLIKKYKKPFSKFSKNNPDAHEALSIEDFVLARYHKDGYIEIKK